MANVSLSLREARRFNENWEEIYPLVYQTLQNALWKSTGLIFVADFTCADQGKKEKQSWTIFADLVLFHLKKISYKQLSMNCFSVCTKPITLWISVASNLSIYVIMTHHFSYTFSTAHCSPAETGKLQFCHQFLKLSCIISFFINRKIS